MILGGTLPTSSTVLAPSTPKHRVVLTGPLDDVRDYPDNVCPGRHCKGRLSIVKSGHRRTVTPIHYLSPEQIKKAQR